MMKFMCIVTVLFLLPFSGWSGTFLETFDGGGLEAWQEFIAWDIQGNKGPGSWKVVDGELHAVNREAFFRLLTTGDDTWEDYTMEFDVKTLKKHGRGGFSIAVRIQEAWVVYCSIHDIRVIFKNKLPIEEPRVDCTGGNLHNGMFASFHSNPRALLSLNEWSHLKLSVEGDTFTFWINDEQIINRVAPRFRDFPDFPDFQTGGVGFGLRNYTARFDNITVTGDSIPDRVPDRGGFAVTSHGKPTTTWGNLKLTADR